MRSAIAAHSESSTFRVGRCSLCHARFGAVSTLEFSRGRSPGKGLGVTAALALQVFWLETSVLRDACQHSRTKFFTIVKREHEIGPAFTRQSAMRARLALELPTKTQERGKNFSCLRGRPLAHAAAGMEMLISSGRVSPCSSCSASTRSARTSALAMASLADVPYARTPGS